MRKFHELSLNMAPEDLDFMSSLAKIEIPNKILKVGNENQLDRTPVRI